MKSLRCSIGIHREYAIEGFPLGSRSPLIVGVQCERCKQVRCVSNARPRMCNALTQAFDEAREWLGKMTGHRIIGTFVHFR